MMPHWITSLPVSVYSSTQPLGKRFARGSDGVIKKISLGQMVNGFVEIKTLPGLSDFAELRSSLTASQALGYGLTQHAKARVVTKRALAEWKPEQQLPNDTPLVARDRDHLQYAAEPGILMLDHDPAPEAESLTADQIRNVLCDAMPELCGVTMAWASSSGSMIYEGDTEVVGLRGSRMYFVLSDARRIPEVGALLFDRLALAGHARIAISGSGRMLRRGVIDAGVWQPERLDFIRATCDSGLEQRPASWRLFPGDGVDLLMGETLLDVAALRPLGPEDRERVEHIWAELTRKAEEEAGRVRHAWALTRATIDAMKAGKPSDPEWQAERVARYEATANNFVLDLEHSLTLADGREVTVAELRENPETFEGVRMADPFEPEYGGNDRRIACAYLLRNGGTDPVVFSHAHNGTWYSLRHGTEDFEGLDDPAATPTDSSRLAATPGDRVKPERSRFAVQSAADFKAGPPPKWHIRGLMPQGELIVLFGASGSGKSFVALDMAAAIAAGEEWREQSVEQGRVVYVVAEGRNGFRKRLDALQQHRGLNLADLDLGIVSDCPNLLDGDEIDLAAAIDAAGGAALVIIDTLAQSMPGGDENSAVDMGKALAACKLIHASSQATVMLVHHCGKNAAMGARGWSGLRGAADAEIEITFKDSARCIKVTKQKDGDDAGRYPFELETVTLGIDDDLFAITSCVVTHIDDDLPGVDADDVRPQGKWKRRIWDVLKGGKGLVTRTALVAAAVELESPPPVDKRDTRKQNAMRALEQMLTGGWCHDQGLAGLVAAR